MTVNVQCELHVVRRETLQLPEGRAEFLIVVDLAPKLATASAPVLQYLHTTVCRTGPFVIMSLRTLKHPTDGIT